MKGKVVFLLAGVFAFFALQDVSYAQTHFTAVLNAAQEVPTPTITTTPAPTGTGVFRLTGDEMTGFQLRFQVTVSNLSGPIIAAHFHRRDAGIAGSVIRGMSAAEKNGNTFSGVWSSTDAQALTPEFVRALLGGEIYFNVHTMQNPGGEIRGQLYPTLSFVARLDTAQEVPAPTVMGNPAGTAALTLRTAANGGAELLFEITVDGLSGSIAAAHFHRGAPGVPGPIFRTITNEFIGTTASGVWRSAVQTQPLTPDLLRALVNGEIYLNVHTATNPGGEIRGQVGPE